MTLSGRRSIVVNALNLAGARLFTYGLRGVYILFLAAALGPAAYGLLVYAQSWSQAFLPLSVLGLTVVMSREIGRDRANAQSIASRILAIQITTGAIAFMACLGIGLAIEGTTEGRALILAFSIALAGRVPAVWANDVFVATENARLVLRIEAAFRLLDIALGTIAVLSGGGALSVAIVFAFTWSCQSVVAIIMVRRLIGGATPRFGDWMGVRAFVIRALPVAIGSIGVVWLMQGGMVLYRHFAGAGESLGQLGLAMQAFILLAMLANAVSNASMPVLSRAAQRQDGKDMLFLDAFSRVAIIGGGGAALLGMAFGPWILTTLLGAPYLEAGRLLGLALWVIVPFAVCGLAGNVLVAHDRRAAFALCSLAGAATMSVALPPLVLEFGAPGALYAMGLGSVVFSLLMVAVVCRIGVFNPWRAVLRPSVAAIMALAVMLVARQPLGSVMAVAAALGTLVIAALVLRVVAAREWRYLGQFIKNRGNAAGIPDDSVS